VAKNRDRLAAAQADITRLEDRLAALPQAVPPETVPPETVQPEVGR
jgi:hypothetical protein